MELDKTEDYRVLKGGIDINRLEKLIFQLINLFTINKTSWSEGIESLNDLIYLKKHDGSTLSNETSELILNWIGFKYDNKIFEGFPESHDGNDQKSKNLVFTMDLTLDTIFNIRHNMDVLPFLASKLKESSNEYESYEIRGLINWVKETKANPKQEISNDVLNQILSRVDNYFESEYDNENDSYLLCGLGETIREHKLCYSIHWCQKSEKHMSRTKKAGWVGAGALMLSKVSDKFEMMGSSPGVDWIHLFELDIQGLEEYFHLEIPYEKENISRLKSAIKCSTNELLNMVDSQEKIIYTESKSWCDHFPEFQEIADDLNKYGIDCQVEVKTRKKATNNI